VFLVLCYSLSVAIIRLVMSTDLLQQLPCTTILYAGARGSVVGCGTMLQKRRRDRFPMRSLYFSMDQILPAAL
jgi:hypothetical protein